MQPCQSSTKHSFSRPPAQAASTGELRDHGQHLTKQSSCQSLLAAAADAGRFSHGDAVRSAALNHAPDGTPAEPKYQRRPSCYERLEGSHECAKPTPKRKASCSEASFPHAKSVSSTHAAKPSGARTLGDDGNRTGHREGRRKGGGDADGGGSSVRFGDAEDFETACQTAREEGRRAEREEVGARGAEIVAHLERLGAQLARLEARFDAASEGAPGTLLAPPPPAAS